MEIKQYLVIAVVVIVTIYIAIRVETIRKMIGLPPATA